MSDIQVIDRAASILELLADASEPLPLAMIAREVGLSRSTTRRVLASLEEHGMCEHFRGGRYQLGLRLFEWGSHVRGQLLDIRERGHDGLRDLALETGLTSFLCLRESDRAVCIDRVDGRFAHSLALKLGGSLPLHVGAAPRVLLAYSGREEIGEYLARVERQSLTDQTLTDVDEITRDLAEVRARGWAVSDGDVTIGVAALGVPVFDHTGNVVAALSVSGLIPHVLGDEMDMRRALILRAAEVISAKLGFRGEVAPVRDVA